MSNTAAAQLRPLTLPEGSPIAGGGVLGLDRFLVKRKSVPCFESFSKQWLKLRALKCQPSSVKTYERMLCLYVVPAFGDKPLTSITKPMVKAFIAALLARKLARATVKLASQVLDMVLSEAEDDELIPSNPARRVAGRLLPKAREDSSPVKALDRGQLGRFLAVAAQTEQSYYSCLLFMSRTGVRISEALAARWEDCDLESGLFIVRKSKSGRPRNVPLTGDMVSMLGTMKQGASSPVVFDTGTGRAPSQTAIRNAFKRILKSASLPRHFHPHSLRHSVSSILDQEGADLDYIARILGHSDKATTRLYAHNFEATARPVVDRLVTAVPAEMPKNGCTQTDDRKAPVSDNPPKANPEITREADDA